MKVNKYTKILGSTALEKYYNDPNGKIYFAYNSEDTYQVADSFLYYELNSKLCAGLIKLIYIEGPSLGTNVEVE